MWVCVSVGVCVCVRSGGGRRRRRREIRTLDEIVAGIRSVRLPELG